MTDDPAAIELPYPPSGLDDHTIEDEGDQESSALMSADEPDERMRKPR